MKRALTGAAYVAVTIGAAWTGPVTTLLVFLPVCALAALELHRLQWPRPEEGPPAFWTVVSASALYLALAAAAFAPALTATVLLTILAALVFIGLTGTLLRNMPAPAHEAGAQMLVLFYVAVPFGLITHLLTIGPAVFIGFMVLLWTNDTGAYLVGRSIGRTKLMPAISPKKTVEGLLGGVLLTLAAAWLLHRGWPVLSLPQWLACAVAVSITATIGDLLESAFKRACGVKDSGTVLPGHGGILDRFDGFLLAAPAMLLAIRLFQR
jgi:phosphatidate cytidylyltransferase